jgi:hypothetical protein
VSAACVYEHGAVRPEGSWLEGRPRGPVCQGWYHDGSGECLHDSCWQIVYGIPDGV